jgi:hypothetical protein
MYVQPDLYILNSGDNCVSQTLSICIDNWLKKLAGRLLKQPVNESLRPHWPDECVYGKCLNC